MMALDVTSFENISLPGANIYIGPCDEHKSIGFLRLDPHASIPKHNRPAEEWLVQTEGTSEVILFDGEKEIKRVTLKRGDSMKIPANQFHQHTNKDNTESLTSWRFDGNILGIIENLKSTYAPR